MGKNIVILTMGLEIGGAETHIVELAKALKDKGHNVTVFSNGGVFVEQLIQANITHISAPMNTKQPTALIKSIRILSDFCKNNPVSVIHSHTRITNYIAHHVCKRYRIPLVTTVHFNFKLNLFTKLFSRWGMRSLSVSDDLKTYVTESYGVDPSKVRITVNGINLNTFCKGTNPQLRAKYNLNENHKVILCVSRIDTGACENVFRFLESAEMIYAAIPQARIVIVGNGNRFSELKQIVSDINLNTTDNYIQLAGAQTNISDYCRMADAFAGVSRSALEAMASKLPTILIGNAGYLGVYSESIHQACIDTNFTCRGYDYVSPSEVAKIMIGMLATPKKYIESIESGYRLIEKKYSVVAMAEDALASYDEAENDLHPYDLLISGYYGTGNFGDHIALNAIISNISKQYPIKKITVLCHDADKLPEDPRIEAIHRFNLIKIFSRIKKTKLFLLGGGSLLQDITSNRSLFYYLFMLRCAQRLGAKTMIYGNGIGPIVKKRHQYNLLKTLDKVDQITIRDSISYNYLLENGLSAEKITLTADEAYNYNITKDFKLPDDFTAPSDKKILLVNLRNYAIFSKDISLDIAIALKQAATENNLFPVLLPVQFSQDYPLLQKVSAQLDIAHHIFTHQLNEQEIIALIDKCDCLLTERLHPIIFATRMQKPFVCIVYDPKVSATAHKFKMDRYALDLTQINATTLYDALTQMLQHRDEIVKNLTPIACKEQKLSCINSQIAGQLLSQ